MITVIVVLILTSLKRPWQHFEGELELQFLCKFCVVELKLCGAVTRVRLRQMQEQRYPFLTVRAVFLCVQTKAWLPVLGIFIVRTDVNACV